MEKTINNDGEYADVYRTPLYLAKEGYRLGQVEAMARCGAMSISKADVLWAQSGK